MKGLEHPIHSAIIKDAEPVYFLDLTVENVRCFGEKQTLDLSNGNGKPARWTVILGDNGTGKTTLLQCLVALESHREFYEDTRPGEEEPPAAIPRGVDLMLESKFERYKGEGFIVESHKFYLGFFTAQAAHYFEGYYFGQKRSQNQLLGIFETVQTEKIKNLIIYAYGASRRMGHGALTDTQENNITASLFFDDVSLINAEEWLLQAYFAVQNAESDAQAYFENRYNKIKETLIRLLDDARDFRIKPITKAQPKPAIEVGTPYGWVDMNALSLGYQSLIAWVVDLASRLFERYPDSENPLAESAIVLVDEIDLHLHPKWQRTIISYLTEIFKNTQFIVTAHSPLIVQAAVDANVVLLQREGDQVIIHNRKDKDIIKGWRFDQVLTSDLFELPSARPPEYDKYLERQQELLVKAELSPEDEQELETLAEKLDELQPVLEQQEDREAMQILRKAAEILKSEPVHS